MAKKAKRGAAWEAPRLPVKVGGETKYIPFVPDDAIDDLVWIVEADDLAGGATIHVGEDLHKALDYAGERYASGYPVRLFAAVEYDFTLSARLRGPKKRDGLDRAVDTLAAMPSKRKPKKAKGKK